jgi:hypothetical protein
MKSITMSFKLPCGLSLGKLAVSIDSFETCKDAQVNLTEVNMGALAVWMFSVQST